MIRSEAETIANNAQKAAEMMGCCRSCLGIIPSEDNAEWMKDCILSRCHDVEQLILEIKAIYEGAAAYDE